MLTQVITEKLENIPLTWLCRTKKLLGSVALATLLLIVCACSQSPLEKKIREIAADPSLQIFQSYASLVEMVMANPQDYEPYISSSGKVDHESLQNTILSIGRDEDESFSWDMSGYAAAMDAPLSLRLLLERSGSMTGYDARGGSGRFKRALNELINRFPAGSGSEQILIVNSEIVPFKGSFTQFVQDRDIFATTRNVGNPAYTDFGKIFHYALSDTVPGRISVLITDMIYSPEEINGVSSDKLRNEALALMSYIAKKYSGKSMMVLRLRCDYHGAYYPYDSPKEGFKYNGKRPYYMVFMGNDRDMDRLLSGAEYASMRDFRSLPGYEGFYYMGRNIVQPGYYGIMPRDKADCGLYSIAPGDDDSTDAHRIMDVQPDKNGKYTFSIAADLSSVPADYRYVKDAAHWQTSHPDMLQVLAVDSITDPMRNVRNKRFLSRATHLIRMQADSRLNGKIEIRLLNLMPHWVAEGSTADDRNAQLPRFSSTTFGLQEMMKGLYQGFYGTAKAPDYVVYRLKIEN